VPVGQKLKALRSVRNITVREVEKASRRIAEAKGDKRFCISNGWLAQLEKGASEPSICKLFSLSVIYHVKFLELIRLYDVDLDEIKKYEQVANPHLTQLLSADPRNADLLNSLGVSGFNLPERVTCLVPGARRIANMTSIARIPDPGAGSIIYGYIGLNDFTMYPLIRPGAFVRIDTAQDKLQAVTWHNEYERPIYFIELRDAYTCGWCELQGNQLLIIPHHSSPRSIRRLTYLKEAEIVGRVTGFDTRCVDQEFAETGVTKGQKTARAQTIAR
jgi:transcriptional regulator with XRE-family HTH domain